MQVRYHNGIHLPGLSLWLDAHQARPLAVVTHGHSDHIRRHEEVYCTVATAAIMRRRGITRSRFRTLRFGEPAGLGDGQVTLYPAGHILGSAQVLVEQDGHRLLYSGDFKLRPGRSTEPAQVPAADTLIMETTFGKPRYQFPPTEEVVALIRSFCLNSLAAGRPPVLFCYSLGKGQEVLSCLQDLPFPIYLQQQHWEMADLYRGQGVELPPFHPFQPGQKLDGALLCAGSCRKLPWFAQLGPVRTAYISGWALDAGAPWRFRTDAAFPLSDHADYPGLLEYVERSGARRVYTVHGFVDDFSADLRRRGIWSEPLRAPGPQLRLFEP